MPSCPTCKSFGRLFNKKYQITETCPDCNGRGILSNKELEFVEFYNHKKQVESEISHMENDDVFLEQYERTIKE